MTAAPCSGCTTVSPLRNTDPSLGERRTPTARLTTHSVARDRLATQPKTAGQTAIPDVFEARTDYAERRLAPVSTAGTAQTSASLTRRTSTSGTRSTSDPAPGGAKTILHPAARAAEIRCAIAGAGR